MVAARVFHALDGSSWANRTLQATAGHAPGNGWGRRVVSASLPAPSGFR